MNTSRISSKLLSPISPWKNDFVNLKGELFQNFEDVLREQNLQIEELESKIHSQENAFKKLDGRRTCLHIHVILFKEGDDSDV